ncbi:STAS domain-containing protein [Methylocaldum sp.]|uniref:STAS domain-containing protein n=1 Tax=Methylocaldum sp. TaxID=1969727 RepID=UPI002D2FD1DC|nr:STAS domain-containing protein [Methylocaldum sp.]HYE34067.1 STAS domain-containing protein [Methylocaldum sp.]
MKAPILKIGPYLIASLQAELTDTDLLELQDALVEQVGRFRSRGVILDVTTLDVMDSFATRTLRNIAQAVGLRGADAVIAGIRPEVALAMVQLGLDLRLSCVRTTLDLEEALAILDHESKGSGRRG